MFKKAGQRGRSERRVEAYSFWYVEALSDARTMLDAFFNILLRGDGCVTGTKSRRDLPAWLLLGNKNPADSGSAGCIFGLGRKAEDSPGHCRSNRDSRADADSPLERPRGHAATFEGR